MYLAVKITVKHLLRRSLSKSVCYSAWYTNQLIS